MLFAAGISTPFFTTVRLWFFRESHSLLSTVYQLGKDGEWFLCAIVGLFSVVFPAAKLTALIRAVNHADPAHAAETLTVVDKLGKWSMLDVFALAVFVVAVKLGGLVTARLAPGAYSFVISVILAMIATMLLRRELRSRSGPP